MQDGQTVHTLCRKNYTRPAVKKKPDELENISEQLIESGEVDLRNVCMFCSKSAKSTGNRKKGMEVHQVKNESFEISIHQCIGERNDKWAQEVRQRIGNSNLKLIGATYHQQCSVVFRTGKSMTSSESQKKVGRPQDENRDEAFLKICSHMMENEGDVFSIADLCDQMDRECGEGISYSRKYFKQKLLEHFGDNIVIGQISGSNDLVLFR